ncbi:unnamed protein product [Callosobruchus maculatus]|uniref:Uncharacterized protein n=2 Tax=Callosobruchus maculatus TaxID=64391 RepID=A0A653BN55_CALMS|nr:unnamed protein product [Callosobruchus maculatus]
MTELNEIEDVLLGESNGIRRADTEIDPELLKLLGDEPHGKEPEFGPEVDPQIAERWTEYLTSATPRDDKEEVTRKYPIPKNIPHLKPPALNPELEILLQTNSKKEDRYKCNVQANMGVALAALAGAIDTLLKSDLPADEMKKEVLPNVVDASKIICGAFRMMTINRKYTVEVNLDRPLKQVIKDCKPDAQYLCGPNLGLALNVKKLPNRRNRNRAKTEAKPEAANASTTDVSMTDVSQTAEEGDGSVAETPAESTGGVDEDENAQGNADADLVKLLGEEPAKAQGAAMGPEVHTAIASRWVKFLTRGVERKEMDQFNKKYLVPKNIPELRAPKLNPQLKSKLSDQNKREDRYIAMIQSGIGVGLTAIAETIDQVLRNEIAAGEVKTALLPRIVDAGKIMCGMFNALTTNRKYRIEFKLDKQYKYLVKESIPDEWLCGHDFGTKISLIESQFDTLKQLKKIDTSGGNAAKRQATGSAQKLGVKTATAPAKVGGAQTARKRWRPRTGPKAEWGGQGQGVKRKSSDWHQRPSNYSDWASRQPQPLMSARTAWNPWM